MNAQQAIAKSSEADFHTGYRNLDKEYGYWVTEIEGKVPNDLRGTLFRNGPGKMHVGEQQYGHWFDGPGMLNSVSFVDGKVFYQNKFVRTPKYVSERKHGKITHRGYGTQKPGGFLSNIGQVPGNPANTNIQFHGDKLKAYYEGGQPYAINPSDLSTIGVDYCDGALNSQKFMSAHGKINQKTGEMINFGVSVGVGVKGLQYNLDVYRFDKHGRLLKSTTIQLDRFPFLHDFGVTENYAVFFISSFSIRSMSKMIMGASSVAEQTQFDPNQAVDILVVDLRSMKVTTRAQTDPGLIVHFSNSYEMGDEIISDFMLTSDLSNFDALGNVFAAERVVGAPYHRFRINVKTGKVTGESLQPKLGGEFPVFNNQYTGQPSRYSYWVAPIESSTSAGEFFNTYVKTDLETGNTQTYYCGDDRFTSEAVFAAKQNAKSEDDGYLISFVYDAVTEKTDIIIVDAMNLDNEVARLHLKHHVPYGFHGNFVDKVFI